MAIRMSARAAGIIKHRVIENVMPIDEKTQRLMDLQGKVIEHALAGDVDSAEYKAMEAELEALQRELEPDGPGFDPDED